MLQTLPTRFCNRYTQAPVQFLKRKELSFIVPSVACDIASSILTLFEKRCMYYISIYKAITG